MTLLSARGNTEAVCLCADADVSLHCALSPRSHPSTSGLGSKDHLTKQLLEKSFSPAEWGLPTVVSFLSYCLVIIQSTGFELQIREEEDDPGERPAGYGAEVKEWEASAGWGEKGQVYGNWRGPSKIRHQMYNLQYTFSFMWFKMDIVCSLAWQPLNISANTCLFIYYDNRYVLSPIHYMMTQHETFSNRLENKQTISKKWSESKFSAWDTNLKCDMFCKWVMISHNDLHVGHYPLHSHILCECCPHIILFLSVLHFMNVKKMGERKLISNKCLTEWLLFCTGHMVLHTCQVLCGPPPGPVLCGKVHDERPPVVHQRAHWDLATSRTEGHSVDRGNMTPSDRSSIQPTQGHADSLARRRSGARSFTSTDSLPADPRLEMVWETEMFPVREREMLKKLWSLYIHYLWS